MTLAAGLVTVVAMRGKFPEFSSVPDSTIEFALEEAARNVDDSWLAGDQALGLMYLAAHYIMVAVSRGDSGQQVKSETIGRMSITYATPQQPTPAEESDLTTSPYGVRFLELTKLNFPPIMVV